MSNSVSGTFFAFLLGSAAGAMAGVVFAADRGMKTEKSIRKGDKKARAGIEENLNESISELKDQISGFVNDVTERIELLEAKLETRNNNL